MITFLEQTHGQHDFGGEALSDAGQQRMISNRRPLGHCLFYEIVDPANVLESFSMLFCMESLEHCW